MTLQEAIMLRHSVRRYVHKPLSAEIIETLRKKIEECNAEEGCTYSLSPTRHELSQDSSRTVSSLAWRTI